MIFGQPGANCPVRGNSLISAKDIGIVSVEGVTSQDIPATSQCIKSVEGDEKMKTERKSNSPKTC